MTSIALRLFDTISHLKHRHNPLSASNTLDDAGRQFSNDITQAINNLLQRLEDFVAKASFANLFPYLLNGVHFGCIGRNEHQRNLIGNSQRNCLVPHRTVTDQQDLIIGICLRQFRQEYVHAFSVAIGKYQKEALSILWFYSTIYVSIFSNMMARNRRTLALSAPTGFWLVDSPKACFILKHYSDVLAGILGNDFGVRCFNFFEESCSSWLAAFGCFDLGITLRHPCRPSTRYA